MKVPYAWSCLACSTPNEATATKCVKCGLASHATGAEIEATKLNLQNPGEPRRVPKPDIVAQLEASLAPLPFAGKALAILLGVVILVAIVSFQASISLVVMAVAFVAGFAALVLLAILLAHAEPMPPASTRRQPPPDA